MTCETVIDFPRGDNTEIYFLFLDKANALLDLAGSRFVLTLAWAGGTLTKDTLDVDGLAIEEDATTTTEEGTTYVGDRLTWYRTVEESRIVPSGNLTEWEVERRIAGAQESWGSGRFNGYGGLTPDD